MKVLIVEDNTKNLKLFSLILKSLDYDVFTADDGEEGLAMAKEIMPDLILMDIQMPRMDGITAIKRLRDDEAISALPVIALTSYAMKGDRERMLGAGFDDYISKPIDKSEFVSTIAEVMKGDHAGQ